MSYLTSRTLATGVTSSDLIHIVKPYDITQNPSGSSYKANLGQLYSLFSGDSNTYITGFTYNSNTFTIYDNTGNTYSATIDVVTGFTINGNLTVTGNTTLDGLTATTLQVTSGATNGYVLTSDSSGNGIWQPLSSISGSSVISVTGITTSAYTATTSFSYYGVEYTGNTSIEIPDATGIDGFKFSIKDERGTSATYPITITPATGNIDGNPSVTMAINYMSLTMVARNNNWWII